MRDRNDLFLAAGYAPPHRELGLDDSQLADAALFGSMLDFEQVPRSANVLELVFDPAGLRPIIEVAFDVDGMVLRFFSTVTTLGTPLDITLQELRIEMFHPADATTRDRYQPDTAR